MRILREGKCLVLHGWRMGNWSLCTILIRQRKPRAYAFEDNAAVIADDKGTPKGSEMRSSAAREAVERSYHIASAATIIV